MLEIAHCQTNKKCLEAFKLHCPSQLPPDIGFKHSKVWVRLFIRQLLKIKASRDPWSLIGQDTLMALMRVRSCHQDLNLFCATPAIQHWLVQKGKDIGIIFQFGLFCHVMYVKWKVHRGTPQNVFRKSCKSRPHQN